MIDKVASEKDKPKAKMPEKDRDLFPSVSGVVGRRVILTGSIASDVVY